MTRQRLWVGVIVLGGMALSGCARQPAAPVASNSAAQPASSAVTEGAVVAASGTTAGEPETPMDPAAASAAKEAAAAVTPASAASAPMETSVMLGDPSLTPGIPGEGPLTIEQIQRWLEAPGVN